MPYHKGVHLGRGTCRLQWQGRFASVLTHTSLLIFRRNMEFSTFRRSESTFSDLGPSLELHRIHSMLLTDLLFVGVCADICRTHSWEHLMIVYYDVRMLDDTPLLPVKIQRGSKSSRKSLRSSQATRPWSNGFLSTVTGGQPNRTCAVLLPSVSRPRERGLSSSQMTPTSTLTACEDPIDAVPSS